MSSDYMEIDIENETDEEEEAKRVPPPELPPLKPYFLMDMTPEERAAIKYKPKEEKQQLVANLLFAGLNKTEIARELGVSRMTIWNWFNEGHSEMVQTMKRAQVRAALQEMPKNFEILKGLREDKNSETRRKAVADLARMAGLPIDAASIGTGNTYNINAQNAQINTLSNDDLAKKIRDLADSMGPKAQQLVEGELAPEGKKANAANQDSTTGSGKAGPSSGPAEGVEKAQEG